MFRLPAIFSLTFLLSHFLTFNASGQNLVPNPSFEDTLDCINQAGKPEASPPWYTANSSPDYFTSIISCGWPYNTIDFQLPRTGEGMMGIVTYETPCAMEYFGTELSSPLLAGQEYCVSFYVAFSYYTKYAIDRIGIHFSMDSIVALIDTCFFPVLPQVESQIGNFIKDTLNWTLITGNFVAGGGERFITIGNFHSNDSTNIDTVSGASNQSYYYIDDLCISSIDSCVCDSETAIPETQINNSVLIYPNPSLGLLNVKSRKERIRSCIIYNLLGQTVFCDNMSMDESETELKIDLRSYSLGTYIVHLQTDTQLIKKKIILTKN